MDKLEHYLDQVCRGIGGPRAMRRHVRQELREHLLDAVAQHQAAGLPEAAALDKALEEFGQPQEVRSELEATHGQRMMAVVIDKALEWKENTMKAKWLWTTWAHLALSLVIALELFFITFAVTFIVPRFNKLLHDGILDRALLQEPGWSWMPDFLAALSHVAGGYTTWLMLLGIAMVGLFEWRVKSENKPFMRLSALGSVAVGLMVVVLFTGAALLVSFCMGAPATGRLARSFAVDQVAKIDASVSAFEQALAKQDWDACGDHADRAAQSLDQFLKVAPALPALASDKDAQTVDALQAFVTAANKDLAEARQAIRDRDAVRVAAALQKFQHSFGPLREAAKRQAP
ncbi:MAG TPA: permease prefix domain 1-containing protein [Gemmataceae bacterium]|nr:permease prefix domain 1-containing protein [Gemmataceae bacterium]